MVVEKGLLHEDDVGRGLLHEGLLTRLRQTDKLFVQRTKELIPLHRTHDLISQGHYKILAQNSSIYSLSGDVSQFEEEGETGSGP